MVKSVSWPTAEMTGMALAAMARATDSSLKAHKSSMEPPPLPTISTSAACRSLNQFMASTIMGGASGPCTSTG